MQIRLISSTAFILFLLLIFSGCDSSTAPVTVAIEPPDSIRIRQTNDFQQVYVEISINGSVPARVAPAVVASGVLGPYDLLINNPNEISVFWFERYPNQATSIGYTPLYLGREDATIDLRSGQSDYNIYADSVFTATGIATADDVDIADRSNLFGGICGTQSQLLQIRCGLHPCSADYDGDGLSNLKEILSVPESDPLDSQSPNFCGDVLAPIADTNWLPD